MADDVFKDSDTLDSSDSDRARASQGREPQTRSRPGDPGRPSAGALTGNGLEESPRLRAVYLEPWFHARLVGLHLHKPFQPAHRQRDFAFYDGFTSALQLDRTRPNRKCRGFRIANTGE